MSDNRWCLKGKGTDEEGVIRQRWRFDGRSGDKVDDSLEEGGKIEFGCVCVILSQNFCESEFVVVITIENIPNYRWFDLL